MAEQSVWALGNIAGDGASTRNEVLEQNTAEVLLEILRKEQPVRLVFVESFIHAFRPVPPSNFIITFTVFDKNADIVFA